MKIRPAMVCAVLALAGLAVWPGEGLTKAQQEEVGIVEPGDMSTWAYSPVSLTVSVGTTVAWKNSGREPHGVTSQDQLFDSRLLDSGKSWSYTFDTPGTYRYFCVPHPWMKGVVVVKDDDSPPRGSSGGGSSQNPDRAPTPTPSSGATSSNQNPERSPTPTPTP